VKHLQHPRVKNYASSVYVLEPDRAAINEGLRARKLELVSVEAVHRIA
jgi:hypothetical protein